MSFADVVARAESDAEGFWLEAAKGLDWAKFPQIPHDRENDIWFPDGELNTSGRTSICRAFSRR